MCFVYSHRTHTRLNRDEQSTVFSLFSFSFAAAVVVVVVVVVLSPFVDCCVFIYLFKCLTIFGILWIQNATHYDEAAHRRASACACVCLSAPFWLRT